MLCIFVGFIGAFFIVPVFSLPFIRQLLIAVQLVGALCSACRRTHQDFVNFKVSVLGLLLIPHLYLISELICTFSINVLWWERRRARRPGSLIFSNHSRTWSNDYWSSKLLLDIPSCQSCCDLLIMLLLLIFSFFTACPPPLARFLG